VIYLYIAVSSVFCVFLVVLARTIGRVVQGEPVVALYFSLLVLSGLCHFRLFVYGYVGGLVMPPSLLLNLSSLFFLLFVWTVPLWVLRKSIVQYSNITGVVLK